MKSTKVKKPTRGKIEKELDKWFSQYIRLLYTNRDGLVVCYTCGSTMSWDKIQNGHFKTRGRHKTRRDENNCRPQCIKCNIFKHGNYQVYTIKMINEYGKERVEALLNDKTIHKRSTPQLTEMTELYKTKVINIKEILGIT